MRLLILGGTAFLGRHLVAAAVARGHAVTLFNRGSRAELFPAIERLPGDRNGDLSVLTGRTWDAAIDTSGYVPRQLRALAGKLASAVGHYTFISSVSVYTGEGDASLDEGAAVATVSPERLAELEAIEPQGPVIGRSYGSAYGGLKALCEQAASEAMNGRALNVRAGLLAGPHDTTDRFTYWPSRIARGGEVLAPGEPDRPRQLIDARDLAEWILRQIEQATVGTFNASGPDHVLTMGRILEKCREVARSDARLTWVADDFLAQSDVAPWIELPLWVLRSQERSALFRASCAKAIAAGLTYRPLAETIRDVLAWDASRPRTDERNAGLAPERERELLRGWHLAQEMRK